MAFTNTWDETLPLDSSISGISEAGKIDVLIRQMKLDIRERLLQFMPVGMVVKFAGDIIPYGFMECNGANLLRTDYPDLFSVLGTVHGAVDATHFNIPEMRGYFARGWTNGKSSGLYDPDTASRAKSTKTGSTMTAGDHVGTTQADENIAHTHPYYYPQVYSSGSMQGVVIYAMGNSSISTGSDGSENSPDNIYFKYIIRVDDENSDGTYDYTRTWDETKPLSSDYYGRQALEIRKLKVDVQELMNNLFPVGMVMYWPSSTCPDGYIELNGQAIDRTAYAELFDQIGDTYGPGDGISTFNVPDARGIFIRSQDNGAGVDSMAASRDGGDVVGSTQENDNKAHTHSYTGTDSNHNGGLYTAAGAVYGCAPGSGTLALVPTRTVDSHPKNMYLMACIKTKSCL